MRPWHHYFSPPPGAVQGSILILLPFALAHFLSYLFRSANAVIYPDLMRDLGLSANTLGLLTSTYFIAFAAAQLPVGMALDRFGPRKVQVPMLTLAILGAVLFAKAESLETLALARGLIGFGVAASLMASIKASTLWLPSERWPMVTAILLSFGGMGGMVATAPLQFALDHVGWRTAFLGLAGCTALVAVLIFAAVPEHPHKQNISVKDMLTSIGKLYQDGPFWRIVLCTLFTNGAYMAIQGLWLGPWLRDVAHLPRPEVAQVLFWGTAAMVVGSLFFGWITTRLRAYRIRPITVCSVGLLGVLAVQGLMLLGTTGNPWVLALAFSFFGTSGAMNYAILTQHVPKHLTGRASTCFNLLIFLVAFAMQWGLGVIINQWASVDGAYPEAAYQTAFGLCLILQAGGLWMCATFKPWRLERRADADQRQLP